MSVLGLDPEIITNISILLILHIMYYIYKSKYMFMKTKVGYKTFAYVVGIFLLLVLTFVGPHYWFVSHPTLHDWHIRLETFVWCCNMALGIKLYVIYGGLSLLEVWLGFKVFVSSLFSGESPFVAIRDNNLFPFTMKRIVNYTNKNRTNGYIKKELDIIINLIDKVTYRTKGVVNNKKWHWTRFDHVEAKMFLDEMGRETRKYYDLIHQVRIGRREIDAFYSMLNTLTPSYDYTLRTILMDDNFTNRQRKDKVIEALDGFGSDIKKEVQALVKFNEAE